MLNEKKRVCSSTEFNSALDTENKKMVLFVARDRSLRFPTRIATNGQGQRRGKEESMTRSAEALLILWTVACFDLAGISVGGEGGWWAACHVLNTGFRVQADHDGAHYSDGLQGIETRAYHVLIRSVP